MLLLVWSAACEPFTHRRSLLKAPFLSKQGIPRALMRHTSGCDCEGISRDCWHGGDCPESEEHPCIRWNPEESRMSSSIPFPLLPDLPKSHQWPPTIAPAPLWWWSPFTSAKTNFPPSGAAGGKKKKAVKALLFPHLQNGTNRAASKAWRASSQGWTGRHYPMCWSALPSRLPDSPPCAWHSGTGSITPRLFFFFKIYLLCT